MKLVREGYALPIEASLADLLEQHLKQPDAADADSITLNFRDPSYSAEAGGYHPVEILMIKGRIQYITDFAYVGSPLYAELVKELDFDFSLGLFQQMGKDYPISHGRELFPIWQKNFCSYCEMGIFQVSVTLN